MKKRKIVFCGGIIGAVAMLLACPNPSGGGSSSGGRVDIGPRYDVNGYPIKTLAYVEVNRANPLNAGSYAMAKMDKDASGKLVPVLNADGSPVMQPLFDYVVIFAANIRQRDCSLETGEPHGCTKKGPHVHLNENVRYLLDNRQTYIKPLQDKGIKVLLGLLGDHDGIGFGYMNAGQLETFAADLKSTLQTYNLDGIDIDEEWSTKEGEPANNGADSIALYPDTINTPRGGMMRRLSVPIGPGNGFVNGDAGGSGGFSPHPDDWDWSEKEPKQTAKEAIFKKGGRTLFETIKKFREVLPADAVITLYEINTSENITPGGIDNEGTWGTGIIFPESKDPDPVTNATASALAGLIDLSLYPLYGGLVPDSKNGLPPNKWAPLAIDVGGFAYEDSSGYPLPTWDKVEDRANEFKDASDAGKPYGALFVYDVERKSYALLGKDGVSHVNREDYLSEITEVIFGRETVTVDHADHAHWGKIGR